MSAGCYGDPEWNGFGLAWGGNLFVPLKTKPTPDEIEMILAAWDAGYLRGKQDGRAILQNDFRNLMDCQK